MGFRAIPPPRKAIFFPPWQQGEGWRRSDPGPSMMCAAGPSQTKRFCGAVVPRWFHQLLSHRSFEQHRRSGTFSSGSLFSFRGGGGVNGAPGTRKRGEACGGRPERGGGVGSRTRETTPATTSTTPSAPATGPRATAATTPQGTPAAAPPQRPSHSDPTRHAKGRTGDCPGPRKETATRRNVPRGARGCIKASVGRWSGRSPKFPPLPQ